MNLLEEFFTLILIVQILHSIEELSTGFHKKWYVFSMPFWVFLLFEIAFTGFWLLILLISDFSLRTTFQLTFIVFMFANGVQHLVWAGNVKKYVPGLLTAPFHIILFLTYFFQAVK
ncbi:hypothetical protein COX05_03125 [candidate division WWE3 bacterium CG22_combo_CG10-13_8_21_14_all_39_12]|uniref:HXXEE domain-containing protein n=2 Tax=Katanobacteria TaxID=422282 RepID=A0A2M7X137_UNCKA|nr:MAG: hypothetical protein COX05_03125 [candidate division WWE3 bacterium CG22_combo_CG10-13_8_21_14_all_39_12]PJA39884.1 MAG: hypothetical protein CO179_04075 [candidate division WWE3 bacterium CG_4_9_14_3_um_filter_39_7]